MGEVEGVKVRGRGSRREEDRGQVCWKCYACGSSVQVDKNFSNNGIDNAIMQEKSSTIHHLAWQRAVKMRFPSCNTYRKHGSTLRV